MSELTMPGYVIRHSNRLIDLEDGGIITYSVQYIADQPMGKAILYFKKPIKIKQDGIRQEKDLVVILSEQGINGEDEITRIESFYPYGEKLTEDELEKYSKKGVASLLLKLMAVNASKEGAKAIYGITDKERMKSFFIKMGFIEMNPKEGASVFYKLL